MNNERKELVRGRGFSPGTKKEAQAKYQDYVKMVKTSGGYLLFEHLHDYEDWRNQR